MTCEHVPNWVKQRKGCREGRGVRTSTRQNRTVLQRKSYELRKMDNRPPTRQWGGRNYIPKKEKEGGGRFSYTSTLTEKTR